MKKLLITAMILGSIASSSYAQTFGETRDKFFVSYEVAVPSGFLTKTSWSGVRFDYRRMLSPNFSVGIASSWNSFSEHVDKSTYQKEDGTGAVTGDMVREVYTVPITLSFHYYFGSGGKVKPYLGVGLGTQYADQSVFMNIYEVDDYNWGFVARPEIGVIVPVKIGGVYLSAAYNYATNKNDAFKIDNLQHFAFNLGLMFGAR